jgi:hypothetical protein
MTLFHRGQRTKENIVHGEHNSTENKVSQDKSPEKTQVQRRHRCREDTGAEKTQVQRRHRCREDTDTQRIKVQRRNRWHRDLRCIIN